MLYPFLQYLLVLTGVTNAQTNTQTTYGPALSGPTFSYEVETFSETATFAKTQVKDMRGTKHRISRDLLIQVLAAREMPKKLRVHDI